MNSLGFNNVIYLPYSYWKDNYASVEKRVKNKLSLLYVGRLDPVKNILFVVRTIRNLIYNKVLTKTNFSFTIVGDGVQRNLILSYMNKFRLNNYISLHHFIPNDQLHNIFMRSNVFILASKKEPVGLVTLEAMYSSLPIIISYNAGSQDYVIDYYNGLRIDPYNEKSLEFALKFYLDKKIREEHGSDSLSLLRGVFDYKKIGKNLVNVINNC